ncbi:MAG: NACHT domain-containing protein [Cyanobacteria bacterium P01_D01_bin.105]
MNDFFSERPIGEKSFRSICFALRLEGEQFYSVVPTSYASSKQHFDLTQVYEEQLEQVHEEQLEKIRESCRQRIENRHGWMRLLNGEEIGVDQLYVDVWLLGKPERDHFNTAESLLTDFDTAEDRLALSNRFGRRPGLEIANSKSKLVILGKPGSGKTTFLKQLAIDWCKTKFKPHKIAVFIEFRKIRKNTWYLLDAIDRELGLANWRQAEEYLQNIEKLDGLLVDPEKKLLDIERGYNEVRIDKKTFKLRKGQLQSEIDELQRERQIAQRQLERCRAFVKACLTQKKLLILMDGLDEIQTKELRRDVKEQISEISRRYPNNHFFLTCRTQTLETTPAGFSSVEVASFDLNQVNQFVQNWFFAVGLSKAESILKGKAIQSAVANQPDLRETTTTPVLLSLLCVVWQDSEEIPKNKTNLYKKGVNWLLRRWNRKKEIEDWEVGTQEYRKLSIEEKENLLMDIAAHKFENPSNFVLFEEDILAKQVAEYLSLSNVEEGVEVLRSIETQHGLLVERADELWSFSHLTFQEYFTVQWLTQLPPKQLSEKIANPQWKKTVEQIVKSQQPADHLLRAIKRAIDLAVSQDQGIQTFLCRLLQKESYLQTNYKTAAIRAFYYSLTYLPDLHLTRSLDLHLTRSLDSALDHALTNSPYLYFVLSHSLNRTYILDRALSLEIFLSLARSLDCALELANSLDRSLESASELEPNLALDLNLAAALSYSLLLSRPHSHSVCLARSLSPFLINRLRQLKNNLVISNSSKENQHWWSLNGSKWTNQLLQVMLDCRNLDYNRKLDGKQQQKVQSYYEANKFLADLMKIEGGIREECRYEIEDGILLPWEELQRRQPNLYSDLN